MKKYFCDFCEKEANTLQRVSIVLQDATNSFLPLIDEFDKFICVSCQKEIKKTVYSKIREIKNRVEK